LPVLGPLFGSGEVAKRNQAAGSVALDAAIQAVGATNAQDLLEKVQADKEVAAAAQAAILATPEGRDGGDVRCARRDHGLLPWEFDVEQDKGRRFNIHNTSPIGWPSHIFSLDS
jgi:hypothetical protein